eukprot:gene8009-731_t
MLGLGACGGSDLEAFCAKVCRFLVICIDLLVMIGGSLLWAKGQTFARSFYRHCLCRMSTWRRVPERPPADSILRASGDMKPSSTSNISSLPSQQTLVFRSDRTRFFRLLSLTATVQAVFWVSAATLAPHLKDEEQDGQLQQAPLYKRYGLSAACLLMAVLFGGMGAIIPRRYVTKLILERQASHPSTLSLETYTLLGRRKLKVPLDTVDFSSAQRAKIGKDMLSFRINQHRFFFLLDTRIGCVDHPQVLSSLVRDKL